MIRSRIPRAMTVLATAMALAQAAVVSGQIRHAESRPVELPRGPAKAGFDIARFSSAGNGWFDTFHVERTELLADALKAGKVAAETHLLVTTVADGRLALITDQMAFHHLAQGRSGGRDWLITF